MTVLAALATAVRERLAAGHDAPLPGFGTLRRQHIPARVQARPDGGRVLLPPSETVRFSQDATDPSAVAAALARTQDLPIAAGATALSDAVDQLEAIVVATGEARLPGVGLFRRTSSSVLFAADTTLLTEINRPYAGLGPVEAAPAPTPPVLPTQPDPPTPEPTSPDPIVPVYEPSAPREGSVDALRGGLEASAPTATPAIADEDAAVVEPVEAVVEHAADDAESGIETSAEAPDVSGASAPPSAADTPDSDAPPMPDPATPDPEAFVLGALSTVAHDSFSDVPLPTPLAEAALPAEDTQAEESQEVGDIASRDEASTTSTSTDTSTGNAETVDTLEDGETNVSASDADDAADHEAAASEPGTDLDPDSEADPTGVIEPDAATPSADGVADGAEEPPPRERRRRSSKSEPETVDLFLESVLPLGARNSRRRSESDAGVPTERAFSGDESWVQPTVGKPGVEHVTPEEAPLSEAETGPTTSEQEPTPPAEAADGSADMSSTEDEHSDDSLEAVGGPLAITAAIPTADWSADIDTPLPDVDLSLGEDLDEDDFADIEPADLVSPAAPDAPTDGRSVLDDIYATDRDQPLSDSDAFIGSDLGAASASATALGLGMESSAPAVPYGRRATDRVPAPLDTAPPDAPQPVPVTSPAPVAGGEDRWFSFGSLLLLAVSLAAIAAAATWPRFAGAPASPAPIPGRGVFGDTLGDAAEAAIRQRQALQTAQDSTASPDDLAAPDASQPASSDTRALDAGAVDGAGASAPEAVPPTAPSAPAERRTLGVAPPSGTAILPPRVAGLPAGQTRALASADGLARGDGFTWVVLSSPGRDEANTLAQRYRQSGYRAGVVATTAAGRTTYRVGVGQYGSRGDAQSLRPRLPPQAPADTWLLDLSSSGLSF